jgi:hypothetical protein
VEVEVVADARVIVDMHLVVVELVDILLQPHQFLDPKQSQFK